MQLNIYDNGKIDPALIPPEGHVTMVWPVTVTSMLLAELGDLTVVAAKLLPEIAELSERAWRAIEAFNAEVHDQDIPDQMWESVTAAAGLGPLERTLLEAGEHLVAAVGGCPTGEPAWLPAERRAEAVEARLQQKLDELGEP